MVLLLKKSFFLKILILRIKNLATSSSIALNPLYLVGLVLVNLKLKSFIWLSLTETLKVKKAEL